MKKKFTIDFFLPNASQYGVLHHFTKKMSEAFLRRGHITRLFKADEQQKTLQDPPDFIISYNGVPQHPSKFFLCDLIEKPNVCCLVDLPYHYPHLVQSQYIHIGCNDAFSERMLRDNGCDRAFFLPVAADNPESKVFSNQERPIDILMMGTFIDFEGRRSKWKQNYTPLVVNVLNHSIELIFADEGLALPQAFQMAFNQALQRGESLTINRKLLESALSDLELYVRGRDRADLVRSIHHLPVHLYNGSVDALNWQNFLKKKQTNIIFHPPVSFEENLKIMEQSKIVLNSTPHTRHGASERVFNALALGALPLTNQSAYMGSIFEGEKDILFFKNKDLDLVELLLSKYLNDNVLLQQVASHGQHKVLEHHTWDNRVDLLLNYLDDKI